MNEERAGHSEERAAQSTVLAVHAGADGYWYIGAGRSIAEGPYRNADHLLTVASDLLADQPRWRIDVFDARGNLIVSYNSEDLDAGELHPQRRQQQWSTLARRVRH
jgi:hypothetical protein